MECLGCRAKTPTAGHRVCPECGHRFKGTGWDGIDAHWKSKHQGLAGYSEFWNSLCADHRGGGGLCPVPDLKSVIDILDQVRDLAIRYYDQTGKPLGVTGEMAEVEAARILKLQLCAARQDGYDAIQTTPAGPKLIQIKGRRIMDASKPGQRLGEIKLEKEWDSVLLVLLNEQYRATAMYEADRPAIKAAIEAPGSKARNERGALGVSKFKSIGRLVWSESAKPEKKAVAMPQETVRKRALGYVLERAKTSPAIAMKVGVDGAGDALSSLPGRTAVSKTYSPKESWTGRPAWWHTIPVKKLESLGKRPFVLVCQSPGGDGFHIVAVPSDWLIGHREQLDIKSGKLQLFLAASGDELFVDQRGKGKVSFAQWLVG